MFNNLQDGALLRVSPHALVNMQNGGNIRRKRRNFEEFKASVLAKGIIQPLVARPIEGNETQLELLGGYGRRDAAIEVSLVDVPVLVRCVDDKTAMEIHLAENSDREEITLVDEVEFARRYISLHHGDRPSAAQALGWDVSRLSSRLELLTCTAEVLDALDDATIKAGHALILAVFNDTVQNNTLAKIIKEGWTVKETTVKANQVQISLSKAKFDLGECNSCVHNTQRQSDFFGLDQSNDAKCANNKCFQQKSRNYMEVKKTEAEERYGKILFLSESSNADRNTVSAIAVGEEQFNNGCEGCSSRIAIMDDTLTGSAGNIQESQCIDTTCFKKCVSAHKATAKVAEPVVGKHSNKGGFVKTVGTNVVSVSNVPASKKVATGKPSQPVIDEHKAELRISAGQHIENNPVFALAMQVLSMMSFTGCKAMPYPEKSIAKLMVKSEAELQGMLTKLVSFAAHKAKGFGRTSDNASVFLTSAACATDDGHIKLHHAWKPTKAILDKYTTVQLVHLCKASGFEDAINDKDAKAFDKVCKGKKSDLVNTMLTFAFDWTDFAPQTYLDLMPKSETATANTQQETLAA